MIATVKCQEKTATDLYHSANTVKFSQQSSKFPEYNTVLKTVSFDNLLKAPKIPNISIIRGNTRGFETKTPFLYSLSIH
jgi:hypothetical protein